MAPKKKAKKAAKKTAKKQKKAKKKAKQDTGSLVVVYAVLAILVIVSSFYTGYLVGKGDFSMNTGSAAKGDLTVIEYSDFECPFCTRAAPTVKQLMEAYPDVTVTYKHFPLESIHPNAFGAAVASECVRNEGGEDAFWTYHDTLFANQRALDTASLKQYAQNQGLDISSCLDNQETAATVREHMQEAQARGVRGTPSFWVGDELVVGAVPFEQLKAKVDEKLSGVAAPAPAPTPSAPAAPAARVDVADGSFVMGDNDASVTLVEFTDYQCPFCKRAHDQSVKQVISEYVDTGKVRYSVRHFPLGFHQHAQKASEAAECVGREGGADKFWAYHDVLFVNQAALDVPSLKQYADDMGVDIDSCLDDGDFEAKVKADFTAGQQAGVSGTPSFFINGKNIVGAQPFTAFQAAIDEELQ
ncbi:MAG: thioredoxin domain-containing protein [Candidatus Woesearchaeota archaeon]|nr:thioredoxin domain-containing protein [Candidatus Woesearchaeota archaeon]